MSILLSLIFSAGRDANLKLKPLKLLSCIRFLAVKIRVPLLKTSITVSNAAPVNTIGFPEPSTSLGTTCRDFGPKILSTANGFVLRLKDFAEISLGSDSFASSFPKIFISPRDGGPVLFHSIPFSCATLSARAKMPGTFIPLINLPNAFSSLTSPSASTPKVLRIYKASLNFTCCSVLRLEAISLILDCNDLVVLASTLSFLHATSKKEQNIIRKKCFIR